MKKNNWKKTCYILCVLCSLVFLQGCGDQSTSSDEQVEIEDKSSIALSDSAEESDINDSNNTENTDVTSEDLYALIEEFADKYNAVADNPIKKQTPYDIHEEHYRTEYRLPAFDNCVGTYAELNDGTLEIIAFRPGLISSGLDMNLLRVYGNFYDFDVSKTAVETIIPILDPSITVDMIRDEYNDSLGNNINLLLYGDENTVSAYIIPAPSDSEYNYELFIE